MTGEGDRWGGGGAWSVSAEEDTGEDKAGNRVITRTHARKGRVLGAACEGGEERPRGKDRVLDGVRAG